MLIVKIYLDFKSKFSRSLRAKHTIWLQSPSLVQSEEISLISWHNAKDKGRAISWGVFIANWQLQQGGASSLVELKAQSDKELKWHRNKQMTTVWKHTHRLTWMTAVELGGVKTGGLSLTSEMLMLTVTVEDMAGEPLSNACTDKVYLDI